jgi:hypothetical protein
MAGARNAARGYRRRLTFSLDVGADPVSSPANTNGAPPGRLRVNARAPPKSVPSAFDSPSFFCQISLMSLLSLHGFGLCSPSFGCQALLVGHLALVGSGLCFLSFGCQALLVGHLARVGAVLVPQSFSSTNSSTCVTSSSPAGAIVICRSLASWRDGGRASFIASSASVAIVTYPCSASRGDGGRARPATDRAADEAAADNLSSLGGRAIESSVLCLGPDLPLLAELVADVSLPVCNGIGHGGAAALQFFRLGEGSEFPSAGCRNSVGLARVTLRACGLCQCARDQERRACCCQPRKSCS